MSIVLARRISLKDKIKKMYVYADWACLVILFMKLGFDRDRSFILILICFHQTIYNLCNYFER